MDQIKTKSIGKDFVDVGEYILEDTPRTRFAFKAQMHPRGIRGDIIRYKKDSDGNIEAVIPVDFRSLHNEEGVKITLSTEAICKLSERLKELQTLLKEEGVQPGTQEYSVVPSNALVINDSNKADAIRQLLDKDYGEEIWSALVDNNPDIATRLANSRLQENREKVLEIFDSMMKNDDVKESDWQVFFESNTWIFGYGLRYQILSVIQSQANYGGMNYTGSGQQRGDFLTATEAETKYTCLVEIKKPATNLLQKCQYRNSAWGISSELAGAVSQIQTNCAQWEISDSRSEANQEMLRDIFTVSPKGIVIVGNTKELNTFNKRSSFEHFRREIRNPEIITYDELYERARFIVTSQHEGNNEFEEDVPF